MSSPARSTVSAASAGGIGISAIEDVADSIDALYRKDEAMAEIRSEVMEALQKEVRSLDDNSWMFAAPRRAPASTSSPGQVDQVTYPSNREKLQSWVRHPRRQGTTRS